MKSQKLINFFWITCSLVLFVRFFLLLRETFFFHDEWTFLYKATTDPINFLFSPHNGHFMPIFNLLYLVCYKLFNFNYARYQFVLLVFHFLNAYLLFLIVFALTKKKLLGIISFFLFLFSPIYWEVLFSFSTMPTILCLTFMELAIFFLIRYQQQKKKYFVLLSGVFSLFSSLSWGAGVFFPFLLLILVLKDFFKRKEGLLEIAIYLIAGFISSELYFLLAKSSSGLVLDYQKVIEFTLTAIKWEIISFYTSSPGLTKIFVVVCILVFLSVFTIVKKKESKDVIIQKFSENKYLILFFIVNFLYLYVLSAVLRYQIEMKLAMSSRYTYIPLFFWLSLNIIFLDMFIPFFSKISKGILILYFMFLIVSGTYFFNIYYRSWRETISNPNKEIFRRIVWSKSEKEREGIKIPTTFHDFYTAEDIYTISRHLSVGVFRQ